MGQYEILVFVIVLVVLLFIIYYVINNNLNRPASTTNIDINAMKAPYQITPQWGWDNTYSAIPLDNSSCAVYTFIGSGLTPEARKVSNIIGCSSNSCYDGYCSCIINGLGCIDEDQIAAAPYQHICLNTNTFIGGVNGNCLMQNGNLADLNEKEIFYAPCNSFTSSPKPILNGAPTSDMSMTKCTGYLSMITINSLAITSYGSEVNNSSGISLNYGESNMPVTFESPDLSITFRGMSAQLFRLVRGNYDSSVNTISQANNGSLVKIVQRQTALSLTPKLVTPILIDTSLPVTFNADTNIYYWFLCPEFEILIDKVTYYVPSQIVFCSDITKTPNYNDLNAVFNFCKDGYSLTNINDELYCTNFYYSTSKSNGYYSRLTAFIPYLTGKTTTNFY